MMRTREAPYIELDLENVDAETALIDAIAENPTLLERPIVVNEEKAAPNAKIGRPPEQVLEIL
ncbi:MAG: arsenate reductase (glutaredoxin), partial [Marinicaulis sp.]|nr:arsenate reductase (glutaredoxin) [Marinicaulis sp.]